MHGVRSAKNERFRSSAARTGSGPFVPYARTCGGCEEMGWVTWPNSPLGAWRCCGMVKVQSGQCPSSALVPPQRAPGGSGQLGTPREKPGL